MNRKHIEPVVEIGSETTLLHLVKQIPVRGRNDPHVYANGRCAPNPLELLLLKSSQEFGLKIDPHLGDLVQQQRTAMGSFECTR